MPLDLIKSVPWGREEITWMIPVMIWSCVNMHKRPFHPCLWLIQMVPAMLLLLIVSISPAAAQTTAERQASLDRVRQANVHYDAGEFHDALRLYKQAHRELDDHRLLYRIGLSYEYLNNIVRARQYLLAFLEAEPDTPYAGRIAAKVDRLETLEASVQSYIAISSEPAGATVYLNGDLGSPEGATPVTVPVGPGEHLITLVFADRRRLEDVVTVSAGQTIEHHVKVVAATSSNTETTAPVEPVVEQVAPTAPLATPAARPDPGVLTDANLAPPGLISFVSWTSIFAGNGLLAWGLIERASYGDGGAGKMIAGGLLVGAGFYLVASHDGARSYEKGATQATIGPSADGTGLGVGVRWRY
jgi:tetratricopeptide (TPR) repeat protein